MTPSDLKTAEELSYMTQNNPPTMLAYTMLVQESFLSLYYEQQESLETIKLLHERLALNSQNSSKPPSTDGYAKPKPKSLRCSSGKKTGGQPGHPGTTLKPVEVPDIHKTHPLSICPCGCGSDLSKLPVIKLSAPRQVFDLPPQRLICTEHKVEIKRCPVSGKLVEAAWPEGVTATTQFGPEYLATLVYWNTQQFIPLDRIGQMSFDLYGQKVSDDTILKAIDITYKELAPFEVALKALILLAYVLGADETGVRVLKKLYWLHILATPTLTWYGIHKKRGKEALDFFEILEFYKGRLVHDCWQAYFELQCMHALCNAHLLRELVFIHEQMKQDWAKSMSDLLLEINKARDEQMKTASSFPEQQLIEWDQRYDNIVAEGREVNPLIIPAPDAPKKRGRKKQTRPQNLLDRFVKHKEIIMAFAYDFQIPFTNNISEQAVRMHKVKQKVSGCFRTVAGAERFARIRSYISTARKQGLSVFQALKDAIVGKPFIPEAPPSG